MSDFLSKLITLSNNFADYRSLFLVGDVVPNPVHIDTVGPLDGEPEGPRPDSIGQAANGPRHGEHHSVVAILNHAEMLQAGATVGVHIGEGVLDLADLAQHPRDSLEADLHKLHDFVVLDVALGE